MLLHLNELTRMHCICIYEIVRIFYRAFKVLTCFRSHFSSQINEDYFLLPQHSLGWIFSHFSPSSGKAEYTGFFSGFLWIRMPKCFEHLIQMDMRLLTCPCFARPCMFILLTWCRLIFVNFGFNRISWGKFLAMFWAIFSLCDTI